MMGRARPDRAAPPWREVATTVWLNGPPRLAAPLLPEIVWRGPTSPAAPTLYLTFDDGPDDATPALLDLLARHDARATFFLLGRNVRRRPDLARAITIAGHTLGQHTDTHPDPWRTRPDRLDAELDRATAEIEDATGEAVGWVRPPYGHITPRIVRWARRRGQRVAMWDAMPGDFISSAGAQTVLRRTLRLARPGSVLVFHEGGHARAVTPPALTHALPLLQADGYRFAAL